MEKGGNLLPLDRSASRPISGYVQKGHSINHDPSSHTAIGHGENEEDGESVWINQLATHLPDQIVYADHSKAMPFQNTMQGILMFLDISGTLISFLKHTNKVLESKHTVTLVCLH